jgi:transcriptional regulator with XRE-family HTH domain
MKTKSEIFLENNSKLQGDGPKYPKDERFIESIERLISQGGAKNVRQFLLAVEAHESLYNRLKQGRQSVPDYLVQRASEVFPDFFDRIYILTGLRSPASGSTDLINLEDETTIEPLPSAREADEDFPRRLRAAREQKQLTQAELGEKVNRDRRTIQYWESGKAVPGPSMIMQLATALGVFRAWLETGEGPIHSPSSDARMTGRLSEMDFMYLPMIDAKAAATICENIYQDLYSFSTIRDYPVLRIPNIDYKNAYVIDIEGDSMYPTLRHGTKVIARLLPESQWPYVTGIHAVSIKGNIFTIKRVIRNQNNLLTLKADNKNYEEELTVQLADILCMFKIGEVVYAPAE